MITCKLCCCSGKSFLLNVLLNSTHGFPVGVKPEPETKGIWIRIISTEKIRGIDGSQVVLLDTEGFYGERATRLYDARVFAVATLLSSHLVYNTLRTLGNNEFIPLFSYVVQVHSFFLTS